MLKQFAKTVSHHGWQTCCNCNQGRTLATRSVERNPAPRQGCPPTIRAVSRIISKNDKTHEAHRLLQVLQNQFQETWQSSHGWCASHSVSNQDITTSHACSYHDGKCLETGKDFTWTVDNMKIHNEQFNRHSQCTSTPFQLTCHIIKDEHAPRQQSQNQAQHHQSL